MVWIIISIAVVVVVALGALAWWTSGRAKPLGKRSHDMTRTERHYDSSRDAGSMGGGVI
jgi:hypothetical protein